MNDSGMHKKYMQKYASSAGGGCAPPAAARRRQEQAPRPSTRIFL
jgi:hypothetical protein